MKTEIDWENPFKAEDFRHNNTQGIHEYETCLVAADKANARFRELIEQAETVYMRSSSGYTGKVFETGVWASRHISTDTHEAKLICVKELP